MISRREFIGAAALTTLASCVSVRTSAAAGRKLDFQIVGDFGKASAADIRAVLVSAGGALWQHCPDTRWEMPGFYIYHRTQAPICDFNHRADGRIAIGLTTQGNHWSQLAYQFAHEFCHALAGHSNDWRKTWIKGRKANHWLEESLCETASLFAMRAMGRSWQTTPPYPNWKDYSASLTKYAQDRLDKTARDFPGGSDFGVWFHENEALLRQKSALREKNNVVVAQLLPLFEAQPAGWEAVTFFNLGKREREQTLAAHVADWSACAPATQREFIKKIATVFNVEVQEKT